MKNTVHISLILLLFVSSALPAAEKTDKAARRAAILMQKMKQDLEAEKSALQTQFEQDKQNLSGQVSAARGEQQRSAEQLRAQVRKNQQLEADSRKQALAAETASQQLAALQQQHAVLQAELDQLKQSLEAEQRGRADMQQQQQQLQSTMSLTQQSLASCEDKNRQLFQYGDELVSLYGDAGRYEKVMRQESFFQLKRVELENLLQDKHDRLLENRVQ